ncbi:MAG: dihydroorotate dehydrogenase-like protein [Lacunisphaera sp.]
MNLATNYLGLKLSNPLIVGASPFCDNVKLACQLQDAGAAALVMRSLFEEQIDLEQRALMHHLESTAESNPEATSYFPSYSEYHLSLDQYLRQIQNLKTQLKVPVIASLNGARPGGWTHFAHRFQEAGADAVELNLYHLATDPAVTGAEVEASMLETVRSVVAAVRIPIAVKISPFHASPVNFVLQLEKAGAKGVVVFNRFYQPDFNLEDFEVHPQLKLSDSNELLLRLRWLANISPHLKGSLAATGGVHTAEDAIKALLAGAHTIQLVSVLLKHGPQCLHSILQGMIKWMVDHDYEGIDQLRGALNQQRCPDPAAFERANYIRVLQSWRV